MPKVADEIKPGGSFFVVGAENGRFTNTGTGAVARSQQSKASDIAGVDDYATFSQALAAAGNRPLINPTTGRIWLAQGANPVFDEASSVLGRILDFDNQGVTIIVPDGNQFDYIGNRNAGSNNKHQIGNASIVAGSAFYMESVSSSHANSNMYALIAAATNSGPGTVKPLSARAIQAPGSTGPAVGIVVGANTASGGGRAWAVEMSCDTHTNGGKLDSFMIMQGISGTVASTDYGLLSDATVSANIAFIQYATIGNAVFLRQQTANQLGVLFEVDNTGAITACNGVTASGAISTTSSMTALSLTGTAAIQSPVITSGNSVSGVMTIRSTSGAGTSDKIQFQTGSQVNRMTIDTNGLVGIGQSVPTAYLDSETGSTSVGAAVFKANNGSFAGDVVNIYAFANVSTYNALRIVDSAANVKFNVRGDGLVTVGNGLNVSGAAAFGGALGVTGATTLTTASVSSTLGVTGLASFSGGAAVTGTLSATSSVTTDTLAATTQTQSPIVSGGSGASQALTIRSTSGAGTSDKIQFQTGSQTNCMTIDTNGLVGIGMTPAYTFDVTGNVRLNGNLGFYNTTPVAQPSTHGTLTGFTQIETNITTTNSGSIVAYNSTFTGSTGSTAYTVGDIVRALKQVGLMAA